MLLLNKNLGRIKALVVESVVDNGAVSTHYNKREFKQILEEYSEFEVTKIYEPTEKQQRDIMVKMLEKAETDENGKVKTGLLMTEMILNVIPTLTDIEVDLTIEEDREYLKELINDPVEVLSAVTDVLKNMLARIFSKYVEDMNKFNSLPKKQQDEIIADAEKLLSQQHEELEEGILKVKENLLMVDDNNGSEVE